MPTRSAARAAGERCVCAARGPRQRAPARRQTPRRQPRRGGAPAMPDRTAPRPPRRRAVPRHGEAASRRPRSASTRGLDRRQVGEAAPRAPRSRASLCSRDRAGARELARALGRARRGRAPCGTPRRRRVTSTAKRCRSARAAPRASAPHAAIGTPSLLYRRVQPRAARGVRRAASVAGARTEASRARRRRTLGSATRVVVRLSRRGVGGVRAARSARSRRTRPASATPRRRARAAPCARARASPRRRRMTDAPRRRRRAADHQSHWLPACRGPRARSPILRPARPGPVGAPRAGPSARRRRLLGL